MEDGEVRSYRWISIYEHVPEGWRIAKNAHLSHHNYYSILIEADDDGSGTDPETDPRKRLHLRYARPKLRPDRASNGGHSGVSRPKGKTRAL